MNAQIPLLLFAKAPVPGKVKTRLQSRCSPQQAAAIASFLMEETIKLAVQYWQGPVYLSVWLQHDHPFFESMQTRYPIKLTQQCAGDLGEKMRDALARYGYPAAVMGCDAPHMSGAAMHKACRQLMHGKSVIGPSLDGGYYFLGLTGAVDALFQSIDWGTSTVLSATLTNAAKRNIQFYTLPELNDIDYWEDLVSVADQFPALSEYLRTHHLSD